MQSCMAIERYSDSTVIDIIVHIDDGLCGKILLCVFFMILYFIRRRIIHN
jgi:hypothetical protein